ncbi:MAG: hypothetical protein HY286_19855 [Planctomycetes bacterium]|nr:hypothetical protein [Planctomycetota bacterium]
MSKLELAKYLLLFAVVFAPGCRSAFGVDPLKEPEKAAKLPGSWSAELRGGFGGMATERYFLEFDGERAWILSSKLDASNETVPFGREVTPAEYERFVLTALSLDPLHWSDRRVDAIGPMETLILNFQVADGARSVRIDAPDATERLLVDRLRALANSPPPYKSEQNAGSNR